MKFRHLQITAALFFVANLSFGQNKTFTMREAVFGAYQSLKPQTLDFVRWRSDKSLSYLADYKDLFEISLSGEKKLIIGLRDLNTILKAKGYEELPGFPMDYTWNDPNTIQATLGGTIALINFSTKEITAIGKHPEDAENLQFQAHSGICIYTRGNNLYLMDKNGNETKITSDANPGIVNGSNYVHRQEFGIDKGIFWPEKSNSFAFYRKDETMVSDYPLVNTSTRIAELKNIKYPMAGMTSEEVKLGVYDFDSKRIIYLDVEGPKDQYLTAISVHPQSNSVYVGVLNREQNHLKLNSYDQLTGKFRATLFEEKNEKWVEPENPMLFVPNNPNLFIWQSERSGFNHLYLYDINGKLIRQLTTGNWMVTRILGFDPKCENLYFEGTIASALAPQPARVDLKTGKITRLTTGNDYCDCQLNPDATYLYCSASSLTNPGYSMVIDLKTNKSTIIHQASNPLTEYKMPAAEFVEIIAADGKTTLHGRLIKPVDFDPNKKYPVIIYVYGGPHAQMVQNRWLGGTGLWDYYMAQKGYVMFTLDNRGSANRGFEFESVIHRNLGVNEAADQMKGVEFLKTLPYVDANRIGVHGWSFGGFMTTTLMTDYNKIFKVGVAGGPVMDWKFYEVMYGERYMDTPQENPEGYKSTSLLNKADKLEGKLLVIHGAMDDVVVMQHSLEFINQCIKKGKQVDFFVYPDHQHNVRGKDRIHLMQKVTDYFDLHLK
jgi:dipeptidyl-peptidase-4